MIPSKFGKSIFKHLFSVDFHLFPLMFYLKSPLTSRGTVNLVTCLWYIMIGDQATRLSHFWRTVTSKLYWFQCKFLGCSLSSTCFFGYNQSYIQVLCPKSGLVCPPKKYWQLERLSWPVILRVPWARHKKGESQSLDVAILHFQTARRSHPVPKKNEKAPTETVESTPFFSQVGDP